MQQQQIIENYILEEQIGQGTTGTIFRAKDKDTNKLVALKVQQFCSDDEFKFISQLCQLHFQNILNHLRVFQLEQGFMTLTIIVTEYCNTSDLFVFMNKNYKTWSPEEIQDIIYQIGFGLWELSQVGIIHRDIKPQNILVHQKEDKSYHFKICDLGLSKNKQDAKTVNIGTPYYMAPELIGHGNGESYDSSVDIWAFGALIYELYRNEPLFKGNTIAQIFQSIKNTKVNEQFLNLITNDPKISKLIIDMVQYESYSRPSIDKIMIRINEKQFQKDIAQSKLVNKPSQEKDKDKQNFILIESQIVYEKPQEDKQFQEILKEQQNFIQVESQIVYEKPQEDKQFQEISKGSQIIGNTNQDNKIKNKVCLRGSLKNQAFINSILDEISSKILEEISSKKIKEQILEILAKNLTAVINDIDQKMVQDRIDQKQNIY